MTNYEEIKSKTSTTWQTTLTLKQLKQIDLMCANYKHLLYKLENDSVTYREFDERFKARYGNSDVALLIAIEKIEETLDTPQEETNLKITYSNNQ